MRHPFPGTTDFSSFLLQAQSSGAKVVGFANAGADTINSIKQAGEFGLVAGGQKLAGLLVFLSDVHSLGLKTAQGLVITDGCIGTVTTKAAPGRRNSPKSTAARCRPWFRPASIPAPCII